MSDHTDKEYGEDLDGLVPPSAALDIDKGESSWEPPPQLPSHNKKTCLFYLATIQAFLIIYQTEVLLGTTLAICLGIAFSTSYKHKHPKINPFSAAHIGHDYTSITSKYDLTLGSIDHWCLKGDDNNCRCEDPLEPMSKRGSKKWDSQHKENIKVAQAALMKILASNEAGGAWDNYDGYTPDYDDLWLDGGDDDWIDGEGARFDWGDDDFTFNAWADEGWDEGDDGFGVPMEAPASGSTNEPNGIRHHNRRNLLDESEYSLDVVFLGDSITEQRQGTQMGKPVEAYTGIKEIFDKTFTKDKGGDFNGIAMGIAGDTAPNLLWRVMNGEMPYGLTPKVWWVGIGVNDFSAKGCSEEVVLLGILRVVEEIQNSHPDDIIVINSILPVKRNLDGLLEHIGKHHEDVALKKKEKNLLDSEMSAKRGHIDFWPSIVSINEELSKFATKHKGVKFFNADSIFVEERDGGKYMKLDLFADPVHPNQAGHKKWNSAIKKRLHEILKE